MYIPAFSDGLIQTYHMDMDGATDCPCHCFRDSLLLLEHITKLSGDIWPRLSFYIFELERLKQNKVVYFRISMNSIDL
jgi:hypothetical protein